MDKTILLLGVDGGGTRCRARLATPAGDVLGEGAGGPANIRFGLEESFAAEPIAQWLAEATRQRLTEPRGDALSGALALARAEAADLRLVA